jgi:hypothetical protein
MKSSATHTVANSGSKVHCLFFSCLGLATRRLFNHGSYIADSPQTSQALVGGCNRKSRQAKCRGASNRDNNLIQQHRVAAIYYETGLAFAARPRMARALTR